jgi:hypothetical protein
MSKRIAGYNQEQMRAVWKEFVQKTFQRTKFRTTFNNAERTVYSDGTRLVVLDEYHGDLEVLAMQERPGLAKHLGSQEIDTIPGPLGASGLTTVKEVKLGVFIRAANTPSSSQVVCVSELWGSRGSPQRVWRRCLPQGPFATSFPGPHGMPTGHSTGLPGPGKGMG